MNKQELLDHLIENKAKHDVILATAIAGYWDTAKEKIERKKVKLNELVDDFKATVDVELQRVASKIEAKQELPSRLSVAFGGIDTSLNLVYPEDHTSDYDRAIRMMQSSVFDKVKLTVEEYDSYVLNNWNWKKNFITVNAGYVDSMRTKIGYATTGCFVANNFVSSTDAYQRASAGYSNSVFLSGVAAF